MASVRLSSQKKGSHEKKKSIPLSPDLQQHLLDLLRSGLSMVTPLWSYNALDWVSSVYAADIDGDGDIEILLGSRDGHVYALTRWGNLKWKQKLGNNLWISTVIGIPFGEKSSSDRSKGVPHVLAGARNGNVYALDERGAVLENWHYQAEQVVRQVYINPQDPTTVIVGSEDRYVHVLDYFTGTLRWKKPTNGWVQCVCSSDIDGDGALEILAGSADRTVSVFTTEGTLRGSFKTDYKVYTLCVSLPETHGKVTIFTSSNGKDLCGWTALSQEKKAHLTFQKTWPQTGKRVDFENRVLSTLVVSLTRSENSDATNEQSPREILVGSEDKHLYILDHEGNILWKHFVKRNVYSIYAFDIDLDGCVEVLIGSADSVQVLRIELIKDLLTNILTTYKAIGKTADKASISQSEHAYALLQDLVRDDERQPPRKMEMADAQYHMTRREYEEALPIFLKLKQRHVQHYWLRPHHDLGHIRTVDFGDVAGDPKDEIVVGNIEGMIIALDIERDKRLWSRDLKEPVLMVQMGTIDLRDYDITLAVLANRRIYGLDKDGRVIHPKLAFPDAEDRALCLCINPQLHPSRHEIGEVILGLENKKIYIYDARLEGVRSTIPTPHGVNIIAIHDLLGQGEPEIIAGALDNRVYVYSRQGVLRWQYETGDRIRALRVKDIDDDGEDEILVGSEDRYIHVLTPHGRLKWRYYTPDRVLSIDAIDIDLDGRCEILLGVADGFLYTLSGEGDLLWTFKANDRIRAVRASDLNQDGIVEIALCSEDQLTLLQMVDQQEIERKIEKCWEELSKFTDIKDSKNATRMLASHENEYISAFALRRLAGRQDLEPEDYTLFKEALKSSSTIVKKELVRVILNLFYVNKKNPENLRIERKLLQQLARDPEPEVRLLFINALPSLTKFDETASSVCFEYLEQFSRNVDLWICRTVVRKLHMLIEEYPEQSFNLLAQTANEKREYPWILSETGRSLAHYFDLHYRQTLFAKTDCLLNYNTELVVFQTIADCAREELVQQFFGTLARLLHELRDDNVLELLKDALDILQKLQSLAIPFARHTYELYCEFYQLLNAQNVDAIEGYLRSTNTQDLQEVERFQSIALVLDSLQKVITALQVYRRRDALGDRAASLIEAMTTVIDIIRDLPSERAMPEYVILEILLRSWRGIILAELRRLRGDARLMFQLERQLYQQDSQMEISLILTNEGRSPADHVTVRLEASNEFELIGPAERSFAGVPTSGSHQANFTIQPKGETAYLVFSVTYDDAAMLNKKLQHGEKIKVQSSQREFHHEIPNPYGSSNPVRDDKMFFGRKEDVAFLKEYLTNPGENRIVLLTGHRRSGKTSLIYQLARNTSPLSPHIPVFIDLQDLALKPNVSRLLAGFASAILRSLQEHDLTGPEVDNDLFSADPTSAFNLYLEKVTQQLKPCKLILLFDEFETLDQKIKDQQLDTNFLRYLRSLMQHQQGVNFLLAGAPSVQELTNKYWSVFFQIAHLHKLSRLKPIEAEQLITQPVKDFLEYDPLALQKIHHLTGDRPHFIHILSETLIRYCNREHKVYVTTNEVNRTVDKVIEAGQNQLGWVWSQSEPFERLLLSMLAQEKGEEGRIFSFNDIKESFDELSLPFNKTHVSDALKHMVQEDMIETKQNGTQYRIPVGLIVLWIATNEPPERVLREEHIFI